MIIKIENSKKETRTTFDYKYISNYYGIYEKVDENADRLVISTPAGLFLCHGALSTTPWFGPIGLNWGNIKFVKSDKVITLEN